jgi:hypothetical protein
VIRAFGMVETKTPTLVPTMGCLRVTDALDVSGGGVGVAAAVAVGVGVGVGVGEAEAVVPWLALVDGLPATVPTMNNRTTIAIKLDQTGCRRGQARLPDGEPSWGAIPNGEPSGRDGWPGGIDMRVLPCALPRRGTWPPWVMIGSFSSRRASRLDGLQHDDINPASL